jgi:putative transposase
MTKHSTKFDPRQDLDVAQGVHVELPLPMLAALEDIEHALFGICIDAGKQVLNAMMEHDRTALCGLAFKPDDQRPGRRAGSTESPVTLGGRRIAIRRPRVRSTDGQELSLPSYEAASNRDPLDRHTLEAITAGVSARRYARSLDHLPAAETERATSKSAVSRRFVALTERKLGEWLSQPLDDLDLKVVMLDGIHFKDHCILAALGVDSEGYKHPLGIVEGSTRMRRS